MNLLLAKARKSLPSEVKKDRKYSWYRFTYGGDSAGAELIHLYSEQRTIVIDRLA